MPSDAAKRAVVLDRITVSTRLPEDPYRRAELVSLLDAIMLRHTSPAHANELLARVAGAWASRGSGQEQLLALRSPVLTGPGACGAFLVLDDGIPIRPAGFCNINQLSELNLAQAGAVEVMRGPGSAVHGSNALHGVVSATPRLPGSGRELRIEGGSAAYHRVLFGIENAGADAAWRVDANAVDAGSFRDDERFSQQQATVQWLPAWGDTRVSLSMHRLRQHSAGFVFGDGAWRDARRSGNANPEAFRNADSNRLVLHHVRPLASGSLLLRPYARDESQTFLQHFILGQPLEENGSRSLGLQTLWSRGLQRFGVDFERAEGRLRQLQAHALTSGSAAQNATRPQGRHYDYRATAQQAALFFEAQWDHGPHTVTTGARVERLSYDYDNRMRSGNVRDDGTACGSGGCLYLRPDDRRDAFVGRSAQMGWTRALAGDWQLNARVARAFRFPQATELYRLQRGQSVEDFAPETLDSFEAGLRFRREHLQANATAYAMRKRDAILRDANGLSVPNAATRHRGIELEARWLPSSHHWLATQLAYSVQRYAFDRVLPGGEQVRNGAEIDTAPRWLGGVRLGQRWAQGGELELEGAWTGGYFIDAANTRRYGGHVLWHLRASRPLAGNWSLGLRLMNLANHRYAERVDLAFGEVRSIPGAGRSLFLSMERRFE